MRANLVGMADVKDLKDAVARQDAETLAALLAQSSKNINAERVFEDTWGEWWGLLYEAVCNRWAEGVQILLRHGADPALEAVGDGMNYSPLEVAREKGYDDIVALLEGQGLIG